MKIISNLSPNYSKKNRKKKDIKFVIIHYTGMQSEIESVRRLKNPKYKVSCHYLINRKGDIIEMVKEKIREEIKVAIEKDEFISKEDANLINNFFNKIRSDLNKQN